MINAVTTGTMAAGVRADTHGREGKLRWLVRKHPFVPATLGVGIAGLAGVVAGADLLVGWLVTLYCGAIALYEAFRTIRQVARGRWGLDVLAVTAIVSTLLVGEFWASLVIVLMLTGGEALEDFAVARAASALTDLLRRAPQTAHRRSHGSFNDIPIDAVALADVLQVRPGEAVPVDGVLLSNGASLDESALTGEGMPVFRSRGEKVLSGAINGTGVIEIRALSTARDSEFQKIVSLVESASNSKAPFVRLADRYALPFTLFAYAIASVAWIVSGDAVRFAEVLVVATPCPLLIAAPVAFIAGMNRAARSGIIVRSGGAFETLARVRTAAFDKTGTLTFGRPEVDRIEPAAPFASDEVLRLVAGVESESGHVLAVPIVRCARDRSLLSPPPTRLTEIAGKGVTAHVNGHEVMVGRMDFVAPHVPPGFSTPVNAGEMAVYASIDGFFAGRIVLRDETRPVAGEVISAMRKLGAQHLIMLTGDGEQTAHSVARQVGIEEVYASLLPGQKVAVAATASPRPLLMVGDGVNDAPVLAAADVGIAMGARGSTAASETADVVVLVDDLGKVVEVMQIARRTLSIARQSIWVGIGLSVVLMVIAFTGIIPAIVGASLQELVDVATIANALRATGRGVR
jgi:heavy metal translocating P-type ATPase